VFGNPVQQNSAVATKKFGSRDVVRPDAAAFTARTTAYNRLEATLVNNIRRTEIAFFAASLLAALAASVSALRGFPVRYELIAAAFVLGAAGAYARSKSRRPR
jgi:hypothetical protein